MNEQETEQLIQLVSDPQTCLARFNELMEQIAPNESEMLLAQNASLSVIAASLGHVFKVNSDPDMQEFLKFVVSATYIMGQRDAVKIPDAFDGLE